MDLSDLRKEYSQRGLHEADVASDPFVQFQRWFDEACAEGSFEPNAMILATVNVAGRPSARTVLLKGFDQRGFTFFTNYTSRKGEDLSVAPYAALLFYWAPLERQVRIEGNCLPVATEESDTYFASRPLGSRLGAWASPQSQAIADRNELEERLATVTERFANAEVPRPPHWGGYRVIPNSIEFWQGRPSRLHDRIIYQRDESSWAIQRLAP